jgi:conjugal transfer pilus assembly protein TrbC
VRFNIANKKALAVSGAVALAALSGVVIAQNNGMSIEEMVQSAHRKAEARKDEAKAAIAGVEERAEDYGEQATALKAENQLAMKGAAPFMKDGLPFSAEGYDYADEPVEEGAVYIAVSLSMNPDDLRRIVSDASKAGAHVVIQGPVNGDMAQTMKLLSKVFREGDELGIELDPRVFQQYGVTRVPTFISTRQGVAVCEEGLDCQRTAEPHDVVRGNITVDKALEILSTKGDAAPEVSKRALNRLRG